MSPMSPCNQKQARIYANQQKISAINAVFLSTSSKILQLLRIEILFSREEKRHSVIGEIDTLASKMLRNKRVERESNV